MPAVDVGIIHSKGQLLNGAGRYVNFPGESVWRLCIWREQFGSVLFLPEKQCGDGWRCKSWALLSGDDMQMGIGRGGSGCLQKISQAAGRQR
jgi:hypothetical protein